MIIAETLRLFISEFQSQDASFYLELLNSPKWIQNIGDRNLKSVEDAEKYLIEKTIPAYKKQGFGFYKITLKKNNKPIGTCGLIKRDELKHVDIGFALLPGYEGQGFGLESSQAILELAQSKFHLETIYGITLEQNLESIKLLEKLGLTFEKKIHPFEDNKELLLFVKTLK